MRMLGMVGVETQTNSLLCQSLISIHTHRPNEYKYHHEMCTNTCSSSNSLPLTMSTTITRKRRRRRNANCNCNWNSIGSSASTSFSPQPQPPPPPPDDDDSNSKVERKLPHLQTLFKRFFKVAAPYWFSDDKVQARLQLASVFALTLATTGISVAFNFLGRDFYNALANKDSQQFTNQLAYYLAAFAGGIPIFVLRDYAKETLSLRWRSWMTKFYMERYLKDQTFYKIQSQSIVDNPDQRIVDDLSSFTGTALSFSLTLFNATVDLISFSNILYGIYPPLFVVLLLYSIGGTAISVFLGKGLVTLNFLQEKKEADFRYGLVRVRENAESIAFYGGEDNELQLLLLRFRNAFENLTQLLICSRNLEFFTNGYRYLIQILPAAVVAPMYFSGKIEFGVINQSVSAFNHILGDFSLIVYQFQAISAFSAVIDRLGEFDDVLDSSRPKLLSESSEDIRLVYCNIKNSRLLSSNGSMTVDKSQKLLDMENLTLQTPRSKAMLVRDLSLVINAKDHLLVVGPSGSGKTSLLRAMAGLWSTGKGKITFYVEDGDDSLPPTYSDVTALDVNTTHDINGELKIPLRRNSRDVFFLPQRPYMVLGTLRQQLLYPTWAEGAIPQSDGTKSARPLPFLVPVSSLENVNEKSDKPTTDDLTRVLDDVRLGYILSRFSSLDSTYEWSSVLSLGEQQRLAFARVLLSKPKLVLMDESTSALDEANETHLYKQIEAAGITYISIGHRRTLYDYHKRVLHISTVNPDSPQINWRVEPINRNTYGYDLSKL
ncbi:ABC_tran domain-containing protein/T2SE domain-containing protein/ABC_membrane_2 domain-containing protein [Cephalotus follicularis]|uniref:ABC_tran domain-containing protein/T2SE domain-containing protein/ABC_membrane_2 domain-containing protein n=1 Tax=Cephalotus follicularis TaxID=3775 RepID=A0A1Q3BA20_CEPFO|nr:ABC_tran domain-containing protein/T2SE domain-containing protein/ABC_membrane_2 domain-containing protein [Cephalotus follicularis]